MAGGLAIVKVVALFAQVNTGAAWVLALHFIARLALLFITRGPWGLWAALAARRGSVASAVA